MFVVPHRLVVAFLVLLYVVIFHIPFVVILHFQDDSDTLQIVSILVVSFFPVHVLGGVTGIFFFKEGQQKSDFSAKLTVQQASISTSTTMLS